MVFVSNRKLINLAIFLLNYIEILSCCNIFNWLILLFNQVEVSE